jgi:hypothetical protein
MQEMPIITQCGVWKGTEKQVSLCGMTFFRALNPTIAQ